MSAPISIMYLIQVNPGGNLFSKHPAHFFVCPSWLCKRYSSVMEDRSDDARLLIRSIQFDSIQKCSLGIVISYRPTFLRLMCVCVCRCHAIVVLRNSSYMSCHQDKSNEPHILVVVYPALSPSLSSLCILFSCLDSPRCSTACCGKCRNNRFTHGSSLTGDFSTSDWLLCVCN